MTFFDKEGNPIQRDDFITLYGNSYYMDNERYIPRVSQSSRFVEDEIDRLLNVGIKTKLDVVHILAWKLGKIHHSKSNSKFDYAKDWSYAEKFKAKRYGKEFALNKLATYIVDNISELEGRAENDPQSVLNTLRDLKISGLGSVYNVTLLYFISRGKQPIYDRFAKMAIDAINGDVKPGGLVDYSELPLKESKKYESLIVDWISPYSDDLTEVFGGYEKSRNVDRALWVYGHLFRNK